jgi:hypothetical protein
MLMGQKYRVHRSVILDLVRRICGTDLARPASETDLVAAIRVLERIKAEGLTAVTSSATEPGVAPDRRPSS